MHEYQVNQYEIEDECMPKGICSINPIMSSLHEIVLLYLKGLAYYLLKLKEFGATNQQVKETVLFAISNIITNVEYNQEDFHNLIEKLYNYIFQAKVLYEKMCIEKNIEIETPKTYFKYSKDFSLMDAIRKGEKYFLKKSMSFSQIQKDLYEIMVFLGKSIALKLLELQRLGKDDEGAYYAIIVLLNTINPENFIEEKIKLEIDNAIKIYYNMFKEVFSTQIELYGKMTQVEVSFSTKPGKAILVSGTDYKKLENVLKAVEGTEINVYTHGLEMLMANAFPKLRSHPNLVGHFGTSMESALMDFASFPGAILMTKATLQRIEYLYRGRLFTLDPIASSGVTAIKNNDFEPLIKAAFEAKGFTHATQKPSRMVGYNEAELNKKTDWIVDQITKKKLNHFFIIGLLNSPNPSYRNYLEKFFALLPKDSFVFSLCCSVNTDKIYHLDSFYDYSLLYKLLKRIKDKLPLDKINLSIFLTRCDKHTISHLLYLKHIGIKSLYMCKCPPHLINPSLVKTLQEAFDIKEMTDPQTDFNKIMNIDKGK
jgi:hydroxylamine reductase